MEFTEEEYTLIMAALMAYKSRFPAYLDDCLRLGNKIQDNGHAPHWVLADRRK